MSKDTLTHQLTETIDELSSTESLKGLFHQHRDGNPLPSGKALEDIINLSRSILSGIFRKLFRQYLNHQISYRSKSRKTLRDAR